MASNPELPISSSSRDTALSSWLLGSGPAPDAAMLRSSRLAAYAYTVLPPTYPERARLRAEYVASLGRHQRLKRELLPLVRAWRNDGIEVLLFKGFHLSEFVYPQPGMRFYGDVDVLLHTADLVRAEDIAVMLGWYSAWPPPGPFRHTHNAFCLRRADGGARLDVHREVVHGVLPWHSVQRRITTAVWNNSRLRGWADIDIREPNRIDMLLVGLVLQRCWSSEQGEIKPHDIVDFRHITARYGVTRDALWERARVLRCERTLGAFLERCDPDGDRLDLSPLSVSQRRRLHWRAFPERGLLGAPAAQVTRLIATPFALPLALTFVPGVLRVRRALMRNADIHSLLQSLCTSGIAPRSPMRREAVVAGVRWATRMVGSGAYDDCLVRALSTFLELRRHGWSVAFVHGARRAGDTVIAHAWVECDGGVLMEMDEPEACARFEENFRFPERAARRPDRGRTKGAPNRIARGARALGSPASKSTAT